MLFACKAAIRSHDNPDSPIGENGMYCSGYTLGILELIQLQQFSGKTEECVPQNITSLQAIRIYVKYLEEHPEKFHQSATILYVGSLEEAFGCND